MKKGFNVNLGIAKSHQIAGQLVGIQLATANILALLVSASSVVAGATMLAIQQFPTAWPLWFAAGGIGVGLALLIEGLTLSALIRIRVAGREIRTIEASERKAREKRLAALTFPDPAGASYPVQKKRYRQACKLIEQEYRRTCRQHARLARRNRRTSFLLALGGCVASMCAGGLFYHAILSGLGPLVSIALSAVFTLAVTGTFVSSEVFKDLQEQAIREAFTNGHLAESAMRQETRMQSLWAVYANIGTYLQTSEALQVVAEGGKVLVASILEELRQDLRRSFAPVSGEELQSASKDQFPDVAHAGSPANALERSQSASTKESSVASLSDSPSEPTPASHSDSTRGSQTASEAESPSVPRRGSPPESLAECAIHSLERSQPRAVIGSEKDAQPGAVSVILEDAQPASQRPPLTLLADWMDVDGQAFLGLHRPISSSADNAVWPASEYAVEAARKAPNKKRQEVLVQQEDRAIQIKLDRRSARLDPRARMRVVLTQEQQQGVVLTYPQIASAARVSRSTVQRYVKTLRREVEERPFPDAVILEEGDDEPGVREE